MNACLVAPLVEELVFRGYFYGIMKRYTGTMFAAFVTSAIFAVAHQSLLALLPLWGFALFLTFFYETSRCLWVPIGIHALFNAINVVLILMGLGGEAPAEGGG
jgi:membrane protease YdiL (CAAX protease family)